MSTEVTIKGTRYQRHDDGTWMVHLFHGNWTEVTSCYAIDALNEVVRLKKKAKRTK